MKILLTLSTHNINILNTPLRVFSGWGQLLKTLAEIITFCLSPSQVFGPSAKVLQVLSHIPKKHSQIVNPQFVWFKMAYHVLQILQDLAFWKSKLKFFCTSKVDLTRNFVWNLKHFSKLEIWIEFLAPPPNFDFHWYTFNTQGNGSSNARYLLPIIRFDFLSVNPSNSFLNKVVP